MQELVDYVLNPPSFSTLALDNAKASFIDAIGCAILALKYPACTKLLGPVVPGAFCPNGASRSAPALHAQFGSPPQRSFAVGCRNRRHGRGVHHGALDFGGGLELSPTGLELLGMARRLVSDQLAPLDRISFSLLHRTHLVVVHGTGCRNAFAGPTRLAWGNVQLEAQSRHSGFDASGPGRCTDAGRHGLGQPPSLEKPPSFFRRGCDKPLATRRARISSPHIEDFCE